MGKLLRFLLFGVIPVLLVLLALLSLSSYWMYSRFNAETPVAELEFDRFSDDIYIATLRSGDFCLPEQYPIYGDQWQLDAGFLKWKGAGVMLGFDSLYRLDRLSGRYADVREQNTRKKQSHDLRPEVWFDLFESGLLRHDHWLVDTKFGSSVYMDIDTSKTYIVYKTEDALVVKQKSRQTVSGNDILSVRISHACGQEPGFVEKTAQAINRLALEYLTLDQVL